jgi:hypothetical protein
MFRHFSLGHHQVISRSGEKYKIYDKMCSIKLLKINEISFFVKRDLVDY